MNIWLNDLLMKETAVLRDIPVSLSLLPPALGKNFDLFCEKVETKYLSQKAVLENE
jgi:hypothetical protein